MPAAIADAPAVAMSCQYHVPRVRAQIRADRADSNIDTVANNFWGKDDAGVGPLLDRMVNSKQTCDELKSFYGGEDACRQDDGLVVRYRPVTNLRPLQHELRSKMSMPES